MSDVRCTTWGCGQRLHLTDLGTGLATKEVRFPDDHKSGAAGKWLPYCDWCASVHFKGYEVRDITETESRGASQ